MGGTALLQSRRDLQSCSEGSKKHLVGPRLWSASAGFWTSFKGSSSKRTPIIDMVCFYIAVNTESGVCTAPPERRGALQAASFVVQVVIWVTAIVGLVLVGDSGFVEMQLIINKLTGKNWKTISSSSFSKKAIEAHLVVLLTQASAMGPPT